jgi:hypothetical protein
MERWRYPSDCAYKRTEEGLVPRGKTAYGDGVLENLGGNSFKVLADKDIVRRPSSKKAPSVPKKEAKTEAKPAGKKEAAKTASKPPVAPKSKAIDKHVS